MAGNPKIKIDQQTIVINKDVIAKGILLNLVDISSDSREKFLDKDKED